MRARRASLAVLSLALLVLAGVRLGGNPTPAPATAADPVRLLRLLREPDPGRGLRRGRPSRRAAGLACSPGSATREVVRARPQQGVVDVVIDYLGTASRSPAGRGGPARAPQQLHAAADAALGRPGCQRARRRPGRGPERLRRHHRLRGRARGRQAVATGAAGPRTRPSAGRRSARPAALPARAAQTSTALHFGRGAVACLAGRDGRGARCGRDRRRAARDDRPARVGRRRCCCCSTTGALQPHENVVPLVRTGASTGGATGCGRRWTT